MLGHQDVENDATIAGFVLQQHLSALLSFLTHPDTALRLAALGLIGTLLRQGMLCPLDVMGQLVHCRGTGVRR